MVRVIRVLAAVSFAAALVVGLSVSGGQGHAVAGHVPCSTMGWQGDGDRDCGN